MSYFFTGFFYPSLSQLSLSFSLSYYLKVQLVALCLGLLSRFACFSLKEFLWPHWFFWYKSILSSLPSLPLLPKLLKYFPDLIKSFHTFDCSHPWVTHLFPPYNSLLCHRSICACLSVSTSSSTSSSSHTTIYSPPAHLYPTIFYFSYEKACSSWCFSFLML